MRTTAVWAPCWRKRKMHTQRQCTARELAFGTLAAETDVCAVFAHCRPKHRRCAASLAFRTRYALLSTYGAFAELQHAILPDAGRVRPSGALAGPMVAQRFFAPGSAQQQQQKLSGALAALLDESTHLIALNATDAAADAAEAAAAGAAGAGGDAGGARRRLLPLPLGCLEADWWHQHRQLLLPLTAAGARAPLRRCNPAPLPPYSCAQSTPRIPGEGGCCPNQAPTGT